MATIRFPVNAPKEMLKEETRDATKRERGGFRIQTPFAQPQKTPPPQSLIEIPKSPGVSSISISSEPVETLNDLPLEIRERFVKTPTLSPFLKILSLIKTRSLDKTAVAFLREYDSLVKTNPTTANLLAFQRVRK